MTLPQRRPRAVRARRSVLPAVVAASLIALAAQVDFPVPGTDVPQTGQTVMVLLAGAALGFTGGTFAVAIYLVAGAAGLPVFAEGGSGLATLFGPSGGYLVGFWFAAGLLGWLAERGLLQRAVWRTLAAALLAHGLILLFGALLLSARVGIVAAWFNGVAPFLVGALVKSALATAAIFLAGRRWPLFVEKD